MCFSKHRKKNGRKQEQESIFILGIVCMQQQVKVRISKGVKCPKPMDLFGDHLNNCISELTAVWTLLSQGFRDFYRKTLSHFATSLNNINATASEGLILWPLTHFILVTEISVYIKRKIIGRTQWHEWTRHYTDVVVARQENALLGVLCTFSVERSRDGSKMKDEKSILKIWHSFTQLHNFSQMLILTRNLIFFKGFHLWFAMCHIITASFKDKLHVLSSIIKFPHFACVSWFFAQRRQGIDYLKWGMKGEKVCKEKK